jgi:hypothetical protein
MRSNLEQITWQLLPPVLTQNAKKFRTKERKKERKKECIFILFTPNNDKN